MVSDYDAIQNVKEVKLEALIFDCDGTLIDTMPNHYRSWLITLEPFGIPFEEDEFYALGGWSTRAIAKRLGARHEVDLDLDLIAKRKDETYERYLDDVQLLEPIAEIARAARGRTPMAVGTGGTREFCTRVLKKVGILDWFDVIVTADDVQHCKPAPDTFLLCAAQLGVLPTDCLVYEDTDPGMEAAYAAGMKAIDVREYLRRNRQGNRVS